MLGSFSMLPGFSQAMYAMTYQFILTTVPLVDVRAATRLARLQRSMYISFTRCVAPTTRSLVSAQYAPIRVIQDQNTRLGDICVISAMRCNERLSYGFIDS